MIGWTRKVIELTDRARARFADLTQAELKMLDAATTGEPAYCGPSPDDEDPGNNPDSSDTWGPERDIRAELIRWLCVNRDAAAWIDPRGLQIYAARISGRLDLSFAVVRFPLLLLSCRIADAMNLRFAQIEFLDLSGSLVPGLAADGMRVRGALNLRDGLRADGEVRLLGAEIGGDLDCGGARFVKLDGYALTADGAKVGGSVLLHDGFRAQGEVSMLGADIGESLDCGNGELVKPGGYALTADRVKVGGGVFLNNGFGAQGDVCLPGADIGGSIRITGAKFADGSRIDIERTTVKGGFFWTELGANVKAALNLSHASVGPIFDDQDSWPTRGNLHLDGFGYTRIGAGPTDAKSRLRWLARQSAGQFTPQPYQQLAKVLRETGDNPGWRRVLIALENSRRKHGKLNLLWLWRWVLRLTIGYGYRPWLALCWGVGIVMLGFFLFGHGYYEGAITPSDKDAFSTFEVHHPKLHHGYPPPYYPRFSPLVYSLDTFLPIISFGQKALDAESEHWKMGLLATRLSMDLSCRTRLGAHNPVCRRIDPNRPQRLTPNRLTNHDSPSSLSNSFSSSVRTPNSLALRSFEPGSLPATT
jgi:hypothetical protein